MPTGTVLRVIQNLLKEMVGVRDMRTILETLAEHGASIKDPVALTELVRQSLYRTITSSVKNDQGDIPVYMLDKKIEDSFADNIDKIESGQGISLGPQLHQTLLASLNEKLKRRRN